jgi:hypothetical protein
MPLLHRSFRNELRNAAELIRQVPEGNTKRAGIVTWNSSSPRCITITPANLV